MLYVRNSNRNNMNNYRQLFIKIWIAILSVILILFILLSMNIVLPLKWRFPAWKLSPHLSTVKTDTEYGNCTDYVNVMGALTVALDKNYSTALKTLDCDGNCILEQYFDNHGNPTITSSGNYALRREYNSEGQWITSTYLDRELHPITGRSGYVSIRRTYNTIGKVETDMYFGADGLPTTNLTKVYGVRNEYNENGQISIVTNLDADGNAMTNSDHFAIIKRTYTSDGKLHTQMFYDENGNPTKLSSGQYGYVYVNGKPVCLDKDGHRIFVLRHFLLNSIFIVLIIGFLLLFFIFVSDRALAWILLFLYLTFIAYMTMVGRDVGSNVITWSIPPNYYLFFMDREILANTWLFVPLGAILYKLSHMWEIIALPIALTLLIETSQFILDIGAFELSDLIANSLGGAIGIMVCYLLEPLINSVWNKLRARLQ